MIGTAIRTRREQLGLTQRRAAYLAGYNESSWGVWERGDNPPKPETLHRIARVLRCSVSEFANNGSINSAFDSGQPQPNGGHPVGSVAWERAESMKRQAERREVSA